MKQRLKKLLIGLGIALLATIIFIIKIYKSPTDGFTIAPPVTIETPKEYTADQARHDCKWAVKDTLNDPGSADFDSTQLFLADKTTIGFMVQVTGRAKNGFGGLKKFKADCSIANGKVLSIKQVL